MMGFGRSVENRLRADRSNATLNDAGKVPSQRQSERTKIGFVAAAGEGSAERNLPADTFTDPTQSLIFNLGRQLRTILGGELGIERRNQRLGKNGNIGRRRI